MNNIKVSWKICLLLFFTFFFVFCSSERVQKKDLINQKKYKCSEYISQKKVQEILSVPVILKDKNQKETYALLCIQLLRIKDNAPGTKWTLIDLDSMKKKVLLDEPNGEILGAFLKAAVVSYDFRYLCLLYFGRTDEWPSDIQNWAEIIDLKKMILNKKYFIVSDIHTKPGNLKINDWNENGLEIESDLRLKKLKNWNKRDTTIRIRAAQSVREMNEDNSSAYKYLFNLNKKNLKLR